MALQSPIKLLVTDMDGTLLNSKAAVSPENLEGIRRYTAAGGRYTIATGRALCSVECYPEVMACVNAPIILLNGGALYDPASGLCTEKAFLPPRTHALIREILRGVPGIGVIAFPAEGEVTRVSDANGMSRIIMGREGHPDRHGLLESAPEPWYKIVLCGPPDVTERARPWIEAAEGYTGVMTEPGCYEIIPSGVSKGTGLKSLVRLIGLPLEAVCAVGDGLNDLEMIEAAGLGLAVANAQPELKAAADRVCPWTNDQHAVREICGRLGGSKMSGRQN